MVEHYTFITCLVGLKMQFRLIKSLETKYILSFCFIDLIIGFIYYYLIHIRIKYPPLWEDLQLIFIFSEIILIPKYISLLIGREHSFKIPVTICLSMPIISLFSFNSASLIPQAFSGFYVTYFCYLYIRWLLSSTSNFQLRSYQHFWIIAGLTICYAGSLLICLAILIVTVTMEAPISDNLNENIFAYFVIGNIIMHLSFIKAFLCKKQTQIHYY
ncbi:hypothetical protein OI18_22180 [Flavihumibacter solisilvae]|uniref:Uncharacterized protein n=1 Tax=Flavihumibacter solisilvae TaxID=1349421 RepID=A0A0C1L8U1_9BACT|nr:hypothetical protein OI18_22180 [Flavihumibacter solisilvae]